MNNYSDWWKEFLRRCAKSKTLWFNLLVSALTAAELNMHLIKATMRDEVYSNTLFAIVIVNSLLRIISSQQKILPPKVEK